MNLDELVRESIDHGVDSLPKAPPAPTRIRARARRSATVRIALPAVAAAGVIVAVGFVGVDQLGSDDGGAPAATDDRTAAYMTWPDKVHLDGQTYKARHGKGDTLETSAMTAAGFVYIGTDDYPYLIDRTGTERRIGPSTNPESAKNAWSSIAGSADHRYAAWASSVRGDLRVSLFDAEAGRVVAHRSIDCDALLPGGGGCDYQTTAVADGVVYLADMWTRRPVSVAWDPTLPASQQVYRVTDTGTYVTAVAAKTVIAAGNGTVYDSSGEPLGDDWTIVRAPGLFDEEEPSTLSTLTADGRWYFVVDGKEESPSEDTLTAVDAKTGESVDLVPSAGDVGIDDDGSVLVMTNGNGGTDLDLLDCALPSGECTTAVEDISRNDALVGDG